jgi:hypothetical protein
LSACKKKAKNVAKINRPVRIGASFETRQSLSSHRFERQTDLGSS